MVGVFGIASIFFKVMIGSRREDLVGDVGGIASMSSSTSVSSKVTIGCRRGDLLGVTWHVYIPRSVPDAHVVLLTASF